MRSMLILGAVAAALAGVVVKNLPEKQASAETIAVDPQEIKSVRFEGKSLPLASLRAVVTTHAGEHVDDGKLETDRAALQATLVAQGYLAATVERPVITFDHGAFVAFPVKTGTLYHVRDVVVTGPSAKRAGVVTLVRGDEAAADTIARAHDHVVAVIGKPVDVKLHPDADAGVVDVELATH